MKMILTAVALAAAAPLFAQTAPGDQAPKMDCCKDKKGCCEDADGKAKRDCCKDKADAHAGHAPK